MNELLLLLDDGSALWAQTLWQASVSAALAIMLLWASRYAWPQISPVLRCWLWRALFGKLLLSLFWSASVALPVLPAPTQAAPIERAATTELDFPHESPGIAAPFVTMTKPEISTFNSLSLPSIALLLWLLGVAVLVGRGLKAWRTTRQWREEGEPLRDSQLNAILEEVRSRFALTHAPELRTCPEVNSPALIGVCRPTILLPLGFLKDHKSSPQSMEFMLAHELAHQTRPQLELAVMAGANHFLVSPSGLAGRPRMAAGPGSGLRRTGCQSHRGARSPIWRNVNANRCYRTLCRKSIRRWHQRALLEFTLEVSCHETFLTEKAHLALWSRLSVAGRFSTGAVGANLASACA